MATTATTQWWIRTDGSDANGGGYDTTYTGTGSSVNYSDQAAAQASWTNLNQAVAGTITDSGTTGLFTAAMIGNMIQVSGQGYYLITALTDSNTVTVTACTGANATFTAGKSGKVGGAFRNPSNLSNSGTVTAPTTLSPLAPGNVVNVRASGTGSVGSPDYTQTGYANYPNGDTTSGYVSWIGYNGTPYISGNGLTFTNTSYHKFIGLYFTASSNSNGGYGILGQLTSCIVMNCTVDANNKVNLCGICGPNQGMQYGMVIDTTVIGGGSSSDSGIYVGNYGAVIKNCKISGWGGYGVYDINNTGVQVSNCAIYGNTNHGIRLNTSQNFICSVDGCTIDNNGGDGINVNGTGCIAWSRVLNNNITNNGGYGINVASGTTTANDAAKAFFDYNNVYNNTSGNYHNVSAGSHDISVNPGYT